MERTGAVVEHKKSLSDDPRWLLTQRVLSSQTFAKSTRLGEFLSYVCKRCLTGHCEEINEQSIGEHVFERTSGYDPGQDNIVRVHASRLRQKLETYFQEEGAGEDLRIVIPKGGYCPKFEVASSQAVMAAESEATAAIEPALAAISPGQEESHEDVAFVSRRFGWLLALAIGFGLGGFSCIAYLRLQRPGAPFSVLRSRFVLLRDTSDNPLWRSLFDRDRPTLIVPCDSGLVLYESQANRTVTLEQYLSGDVQTVPQINPAATLDSPTSKTAYRYTSIVDLNVASQLMYLPEAAQSQPKIRYARDLKLDDLKGTNVVLIGAKDANPWVGLFEEQMNFVFDVNRVTHESTVTNRKPEKDEEPLYHRYLNDPANRAYAVIALLPNLNKSGNVLIFEGTTAAGTEAAADFVFQGARLSSVVTVGGDGRFPYFELLLQTTNIGGNAPESKVIGYRVYR